MGKGYLPAAKRKRTKIMIRLSDEELALVKELAKEQGTTMAGAARDAMLHRVKELLKPGKK